MCIHGEVFTDAVKNPDTAVITTCKFDSTPYRKLHQSMVRIERTADR